MLHVNTLILQEKILQCNLNWWQDFKDTATVWKLWKSGIDSTDLAVTTPGFLPLDPCVSWKSTPWYRYCSVSHSDRISFFLYRIDLFYDLAQLARGKASYAAWWFWNSLEDEQLLTVSFFLACVPQADSCVFHSYPGGFFPDPPAFSLQVFLSCWCSCWPFFWWLADCYQISQIHGHSSKTQTTSRDCSVLSFAIWLKPRF